MFVHGEYFYGNKISEYGLENGYVDYATLSKTFDGVLNNDIISKTMDIGYWEQESGFIDNSEEIEEIQEKINELIEQKDNLEGDEPFEDENNYIDKYKEWEKELEELENEIEKLEEQIEELEYEQDTYPDIFQYYIVSDNGARLLKEINEIVFYNEELDMYVWGVTHFGTSWAYVLTGIRCNVPYDEEIED